MVGGGLRNDFDTDSDSEGDVDGPAVLYHGSHGTVVPLQGANPPGANPLSILVGAAAMANGGPAAGYGMYPAPVMLGHGFGHHGHGHHGHLGHALHHGHSAGAGLGGQPVGFFPHGQGVQGGGRAHSPPSCTTNGSSLTAAQLASVQRHAGTALATGQQHLDDSSDGWSDARSDLSGTTEVRPRPRPRPRPLPPNQSCRIVAVLATPEQSPANLAPPYLSLPRTLPTSAPFRPATTRAMPP